MDDALERLVAPGRALLRALRALPAGVTSLGYDEVRRDQQDDRNRIRRARVLVAMQLDPSSADHALTRALLDAEIEIYRALNPQASQLHLASVLVARARDPDDVWLQWRAKHANFDAACSLDQEALFAAGIATTLAHVRAAARDDRDQVLADLTARAAYLDELNEAAIAAWHEACATRWPADAARLTIEDQIALAREFEDRELVTGLLDDFERGCARTDDDLSHIYYYREWNHELEAAVEIARELAARETRPWDRVSKLHQVGALEVRLGRASAAVAVLAELRAPIAALERNEAHWPRIGLANYVLTLALDVWDLPDPVAAAAGEQLARHLLATGAAPPPILIERLLRRGVEPAR